MREEVTFRPSRRYLLTYAFEDHTTHSVGFGSQEIVQNKLAPITFDDLIDACRIVRETTKEWEGHDVSVRVLSWQRFEEV